MYQTKECLSWKTLQEGKKLLVGPEPRYLPYLELCRQSVAMLKDTIVIRVPDTNINIVVPRNHLPAANAA